MATSADAEHSLEPSDGGSVEPSSSPSTAAPRQSREEVLPRRSSDERDIGWGDQPAGYDDDWYLAERPPHHG